MSNPIDPAQQTDLPFGYRSHWLQPWRAYLDTQPASMLRNAVGINFNVSPQSAAATAKLLAQSGFTRARLEISWGEMSYADPTHLRDPSSVDALLEALKSNGIRPLILLNANDGDPGPSVTLTGQVVQSAAAGATTLQVDSTTAGLLVPGLSGLDLPGDPMAQFLATSVSQNGTVQLSQPLPQAVPAGSYSFSALRYPPFAPPLTSTGQPNPAFGQTLAGWLQYVGAVTGEARKVLGDDQFDVEVWNELSFGSDFLDAANYYNPVPASLQGAGSVDDALLAATVAWVRDPRNDLPDVGIGDGFADQTPFVSPATLPAGLAAIDKHPYKDLQRFPQAQLPADQQPVNALGQPEGSQDASGNWHDSFIPSYTAYFPEYFLSAIQTEFLERDLTPSTEIFNGAPHGRYVTPPGTSTPLQEWVTETNMDLSNASGLSTADDWHLQAKATLRTLASFVNKGISRIYFYAVNNAPYAMVDPTSADGGPTIAAVKNFVAAFAGPATIPIPRSLSLLQIADPGNWTQFAGDGSPAHPPLYNRQVVAFFPFQVDTNKFVIPAYVMTRNLTTLYNPAGPTTDVTRYDLPPETYRLTVGGLNTTNLTVTATDPLTGASIPVTATPTSSSTAVIQIPLTDYPRLITIQNG